MTIKYDRISIMRVSKIDDFSDGDYDDLLREPNSKE